MLREAAKLLMICGFVISALGVFLFVASTLPGAGKLPGDINIKKEHISFYLPLTTCFLVSIALSVLMTFFTRR